MLYCLIGAILGGTMVYFHFGPGIHPLPPANTPAFRNQERQENVNELVGALVQYYKVYGTFPDPIPAQPTQVCTSLGTNCISKHYVDLSFLTTAGSYIPVLPTDPLNNSPQWGSGLFISLSGHQLLVTDPEAELGARIKATASL
jgi:hypothetical protein